MDYLTMLKQQPQQKYALITNQEKYTYHNLINKIETIHSQINNTTHCASSFFIV